MFQNHIFLGELKSILHESNIRFQEPMSEHTTFKVGGNAEIFVTPESYEEVRSIVKLCRTNNIPYYIFGKGSNILVRDGGIRGVVIKLTKLKRIDFQGAKVTAQCGASLIEVALASAEKSLKGLEFASGIPGTIGGAIAMNAGAYGGEISLVVDNALVIDDNCEIISLSKEELELGYRRSIISKKEYVVLEATFALEEGNYDEIKSTIVELSKKRREKQPLEYPSAGSTFKRPDGYFAGKLIQDSGLKGYAIGEAQVSDKHSGFIVNKGKATAREVLDLIKHVQEVVYKEFHVQLETEVKILGEEIIIEQVMIVEE